MTSAYTEQSVSLRLRDRKYVFFHSSHWTGKALTAVEINSISIPSHCLATIFQLCDKCWNIYSPKISSPTGSTRHDYAGATVGTFLCHPYFKKPSGALWRQACWPRIWMSTENHIEETDPIRLQSRRRKKDTAWRHEKLLSCYVWSKSSNRLFLCLIWWKHYQRTEYHICSLLILTWDLEVTMHDLSVLPNDECELHDKSHNLQHSSEPWSRMQFSWNRFPGHHK